MNIRLLSCRSGVALAALLALTASARAQAPDDLTSVVLRQHVTSAGGTVTTDVVSVLDVDGTFADLYANSNGTLNVLREGTHAYARTGVNTGQLTLSPTSGAAGVYALTFDAAAENTIVGPEGTGVFTLTSIPLPGPLVNTSQRCYVTETQPGIIGFVVPRGQRTLVLVRAIGPGLAAFDVNTRAVDPRLRVYHEQLVIAENDNWDADPALKATIAVTGAFTGAFPLSDGAKDAAIVLLLEAGNYTVHLFTGAGEPTAEVLGEIYAVP